MHANRNFIDQLIESSGPSVTFDWSAALADIEGGVFKQLGFTLEQRSGFTETYVRTLPVNQAMALSPVARIRIDLNTTGANGGVVFLLPRRSNNQNANIPEDDTRSVILRVTLPDATSFTGLFRLADEGSPGPNSPYHFFRDDYATADALLNFLPDYDANLAVTLDLAVVENSAGWRQSGTNVVRGGGGSDSFTRAISGSEILASGLEGPGEGMMTVSAEASGTWGADVEVQIDDAPFIKLDSISNTTPSKSIHASLNARYRMKLTSGSNVRLLMAA